MKGLVEYITEGKLSKLNLSNIPMEYCKTEREREDLAKKQEKYIVNELNKVYPQYDWKTNVEYLESHGDKWSSKFDLEFGDIIGLKDNKEVFYIDVKCCGKGQNSDLYGPINLNSILKFGINDNKDKRYIYMCINSQGKFVLLYAKSIFEIFNNEEKCLNITKNTRKVKSELLKYKDKFKVDTKDVAENDYMPSKIYLDEKYKNYLL